MVIYYWLWVKDLNVARKGRRKHHGACRIMVYANPTRARASPPMAAVSSRTEAAPKPVHRRKGGVVAGHWPELGATKDSLSQALNVMIIATR